jgi:hypothetical protein
MSSIYDLYVKAVEKQLGQEELTFKSDPNYQYMLEHSNYGEVGLRFLSTIKNEFKLTPAEIMKFTTLNDSLGKPELENYVVIPPCSPTSLRYVYHAHLALQHMQSLGITNPNIVEVGGGYGGLCLAIHTYAEKFGVKPRQYSIIDLETPGKLQRRVLDMYGYSSVNCLNAENFGAEIDQDSFLVSTYAFSEIQHEYQKKYIETLFPKITHGFIVWNSIPVYDMGKTLECVENERPMTGPMNKFVYF